MKTGMKQNNIKIAVTGGIGSGKSAVANIIKEQGYAVFSCDEIYNELLRDEAFIKKLTQTFGTEILTDERLNKPKLAQIVFNDEKKLEDLNGITHNLIMQKAMELAKKEEMSFCEVPLLFENGYEKLFDNVIVVLRNEAERIKSIVSRSKICEQDVLKRIKVQFDYKNGDFTKYYVIHNNGNLTDLRTNTCEILNMINSLRLRTE